MEALIKEHPEMRPLVADYKRMTLVERFRKRAEAREKERRDTWAALEYAKDEVREELDQVITAKGQEIAEKDREITELGQAITEKGQEIAEKDQENQAIKRELEELRRKLREAGIDTR
jgi:chromosome segregation ATPase